MRVGIGLRRNRWHDGPGRRRESAELLWGTWVIASWGDDISDAVIDTIRHMSALPGVGCDARAQSPAGSFLRFILPSKVSAMRPAPCHHAHAEDPGIYL